MRNEFPDKRCYTKTSVKGSKDPLKIIYISAEGVLIEWDTSLPFTSGFVEDRSQEITSIKQVMSESERRIYEYVIHNSKSEFDL